MPALALALALLAASAAAADAAVAAPSAPAPAQAPAPAPTVVEAPAPVAQPATAEARPRLLVLEVRGDALDAATKRVIASTITQELDALERYTVLSQADVNQLAALEGDKQEAGCDTSSCLAEIAGALGARYVVFGEAARLGSLTVVSLNLFDVDTATAIERASFEVVDVAQLPELARRAARSLMKSGGTVQSSPLPWVLGGAAALVAVGGLAFDALSPSSNNRALDAADFIGPAALVGGAGLLITGAVIALGEP